MKHSIWITLFLSVAISAFAMIGLSARNETLAKQLAATPPVSPRPSVPKAAAPAPVVPVSVSSARVERAVGEIDQQAVRFLQPKTSEAQQEGLKGMMWPDWIVVEANKQDQFKEMIPELLASVQGLNLEELIASAGKVKEPIAAVFLLRLAMEQDPMRILRDEELSAQLDPGSMNLAVFQSRKVDRTEVLMALAKKDPLAAMRELPPLKEEDLRSHASPVFSKPLLALNLYVATQLLSTNPEQGLAVMLDVKQKTGIIPVGLSGLGNFPIAPQASIPGLIKAIKDPRYAEMSGQLIGLAAKSALHHQGVEEMARVLAAMKLSPAQLNEVTTDLFFGYDLAQSQPLSMMDWLREANPGRVPEALVAWANEDVAGATQWLNTQPPSSLRDSAIATFARKASSLDAQAASAWAMQIQNEDLRNETLEKVRQR